MEEKKKVNKAPVIVAVFLLLALVICLSLLAVRLVNNGKKFVEKYVLIQTETPTPAITVQADSESVKEEPAVEESVTLTEVDFNVFRYLTGNVYISRKNGYYGMTDVAGNWLICPEYIEVVYFDDEWISFLDGSHRIHVFDRTGKELYVYVNEEERIYITESGQQFQSKVFYRQGMKIVFDFNDADNYYGIHYYNAESNELIFELTDEMARLPEGAWPDLLVTSLPDETGVAAVIAGDGFENTLYLITRDGYTAEEYVEKHVERRFFRYSVHSVWDETNLVDGWLLATREEERGELLDYSEEWTDVLYNIHTRECVPLPEEYQNWYSTLYQHSAGIYYGMSGESYYDYGQELTDTIYYAVCHGSKRLTEELYEWIYFDAAYIIAGNNSFSHILDYEGNVLAEYRDAAFPFVDAKTLVCDEIGAFYIDENLQKCSDYIMKNVEYCHPGYIRKENKNYLVTGQKIEE